MVCTSRQKAVEAAGQYRIQKYDKELEELKEENRILKNKIIDLENKKR